MGQQQLLLVILVVIIVGITTIVAVNVLKIGVDTANRDAVRQDLLTAASNAQEIWERPRILDGAGNNFANLDSDAELLRRLNIPSNSEYDGTTNSLTNENGTYVITNREAETITVTGTLSETNEVITLEVTRNTETGSWEMLINGNEEEGEEADS